MRLITQPDDRIDPILKALGRAKKSIRILIFRIDRPEIEKALVEAVERGVLVQALIAYTNRGGDKHLRRFEMKLLEKGITVTRTADDLVRYHGKMIIIDDKELYLLAFNFTHLDISLSRSFAVSVPDAKIVREAIKLFNCDVKRIAYKAANENLVVSPVNARQQLKKFISAAKKQLLIYDMKVSDPEFLKLLNDKVTEGLDVRIIGQTSAREHSLSTRALPMRLHARAILRDGRSAFIGSQSLRKLELAVRREVGVIFNNVKIVKQMIATFDKDWRTATPAEVPSTATTLLDVPAKKVAKVVAKRINVADKVEQVLDKAIDSSSDNQLEPKEVVEHVRTAVREEVHDAVVHAVRELVTEAAKATPLDEGQQRDAKT